MPTIRDAHIAGARFWAWSDLFDTEVAINELPDGEWQIRFKGRHDLPPFKARNDLRSHPSPAGIVRLTTPLSEGGELHGLAVAVGDELVVQWKGERKSFVCRVTSIDGMILVVHFPYPEWSKREFSLNPVKCADGEGNALKFIYLVVAPSEPEVVKPHVENVLRAEDDDRDEAASGAFGPIHDREIPEDRVAVAIMGLRGIPVRHEDFAESMMIPDQENLGESESPAERVLFQEKAGFLRKPIVATDRRLVIPKVGDVAYGDVEDVTWVKEDRFEITERGGRVIAIDVRSVALGCAFMTVLQIGAKATLGDRNRSNLSLVKQEPMAIGSSFGSWDSAAGVLATAYRISKQRLFPDASIRPRGFAPKPGEQFYWDNSIIGLFQVQRGHAGWIAGYAGISVRVARGVSLHLGGAAGRGRSTEGLSDLGCGHLYISNRRLVFVGGFEALSSLGADEFLDIPLERIAVSSEFAWLNIKTSYRGSHRQLHFHSQTSPWAPVEAAHVIEYLLAAATSGT